MIFVFFPKQLTPTLEMQGHEIQGHVSSPPRKNRHRTRHVPQNASLVGSCPRRRAQERQEQFAENYLGPLGRTGRPSGRNALVARLIEPADRFPAVRKPDPGPVTHVIKASFLIRTSPKS